jgi:hypothetical protein
LYPKTKEMPTQTQHATVTKTLSFYKENGIWFADLPQFLDAGLGTKANLMMVDGADTFLDHVSNIQNRATLKISTSQFEDSIGHAKVNYGAYYKVDQFKGALINHQLWLCPVTEYVFEGYYPQTIYIKLITNQ